MLHIKFGFDWPSGFRGEMFEYYGDIHVYCPWGPTVPEKKIFEGFLPYMGMAAILVM